MKGTMEGNTFSRIEPADGAVAITPDDNLNLEHTTRGIYVGSTGDLRVLTIDEYDVTFVALVAGIIHPIRVLRVFATGTTADDIVGVW